MIMTDEIERRVEKADAEKSARRTAAAREVGELAHRRAALAEELAEVERKLGTVLVAAADVIGIDELAEFTDVPAADLTRWLTVGKPRARRGRPPGSRRPKPETQPEALPAPAPPEPRPGPPAAGIQPSVVHGQRS
ncbi:hypothetical protein [Amycolatopsis balhimycina]|uniref:hypothetical protein n=1 Tax=Amycolatopsis balhimycina TaxID=208443 RepID=UPI00035E0FB1|nr:hypothetical protein [Amycolatopsis balhimycina]